MKVMLFGKADREDGGLMNPIGFTIPNDIETCRAGVEWLKKNADFTGEIVYKNRFVYNDELEEEIELQKSDVTEMHLDYGVFHIDFERDDYIYEVNLNVRIFQVMKLTEEDNNGQSND
jgi:hypothetical protein